MDWIRSWFLKPFLVFKSFMFRVHMCCPYLPVVILHHFAIIHHHLQSFIILRSFLPANAKQKSFIPPFVPPRKKLPKLFFEASICLLESSPSTDALCDLLLAQLRDDAASNDDADRMAGASAWARLAALVYHYIPPRWEENVDKMEGIMESQHFLWLDAGYIIDSLVKSFKIENKIYDILICHNYIHHHGLISRFPLWESSRNRWDFYRHGQWVKHHGYGWASAMRKVMERWHEDVGCVDATEYVHEAGQFYFPLNPCMVYLIFTS